MEIRIRVLLVMLCLAVGPSGGLASQRSPADADLRMRIESAVAQIRNGDLSKNAALRQMGKEAVPILIEYAKDENRHVRWVVTIALGESDDERAIPVLLDRLLVDENTNVWREAVNGLCRFPAEALKKYSSEKLVQVLAVHLRRWSGTSPDAALLIGDLGEASQISTLRKMLAEAEYVGGPMDSRTHLVPKMKDACRKALFKLGDKRAIRTVERSFRGDDVGGIVFAVEAVTYAGKKEYMKDLLRLLDDSRDAVRPAPGWDLYLRVKDIALNAIVQLSGAKPSFRVRNMILYTDDELAEVKRLMAEAKRD
jgi:HEAT repeat protein